MATPSADTLRDVSPLQLKTAQAAIAAAKIALMTEIKSQVMSKHLNAQNVKQTLELADAMIAKNKAHLPAIDTVMSESSLFTLLKKNTVLMSVLELALMREKKIEHDKTERLKAEAKKKNHAKKADDGRQKYGHEAPEHKAEQTQKHDDPELEHENDGPEVEFDEPDIDSNDIDFDGVHEGVNEIDGVTEDNIQDVQEELMDDIQDLPSIGDQSALLFIVSQMDPTNMEFRMAGAAHLMQNVKNELLSAEEQVLAFAGVEALRNPSASIFAGATPKSLSGGSIQAPSITGSLNAVKDKSENELVEQAVEQADKPHAPFTLISNTPIDEAGGRVAGDLKGYAPYALDTTKGLFVNNIGTLVEKPFVAPSPVKELAVQAPVKAKSIFGDLELKMPVLPTGGA